ncbi:MAG: LapA family protein [Thiomicrorhabdus sp.]|nr:LapA family protein [Thiomicrorhabdus sp.]
MRKLFIFLIIIMLLMLGAVLGVLNPNPVDLNLFVLKTTIPLGLVLALTLVVGALLGASVLSLKMGGVKWKLRKQVRLNKKQTNQLLDLKKELSSERLMLKNDSNQLISKE